MIRNTLVSVVVMHPLKMMTAIGAALLLCMGLLLAYGPSPASAATTITVNSLADDADGTDGECTLREAITSANTDTASGAAGGECSAGSGADVIEMGLPSGTVNLTGALPNLSSNMAIAGPGADRFTVRRDTGGDYRIFYVTSGSVVSISGITITNGNAGFGGGIANDRGTLTITNTTISGNSAGSLGGGIANDQGPLTIIGSTISGNSAGWQGGGIRFASDTGGTLTITNTTISGNSANTEGGGIDNVIGRTVIEHSTITNNTAPSAHGSGVKSFGTTELLSTIVAANTNTDVDVPSRGSFVSKGYNLIGDGNATPTFNQPGDQTGVSDPKLGALADNGGPTQTHALLAGSPAMDAIPQGTNGCGTTFTEDQRGVARPQDSACDIGSFEGAPPTLTISGGRCRSTTFAAGRLILTVADVDSPANALTLSATSSNQDLISDSTLSISGTEEQRTLSFSAWPGESGEATLTLSLSDGTDTTTLPVRVEVGTPNTETLTGTSGADMLFGLGGDGSTRETLSGLEGPDVLCAAGNATNTLSGGAGNDVLGGGRGEDVLKGGSGADALLGKGGADKLIGGTGQDILRGQAGADTLTGGADADFFSGGAGTDSVTDFDASEGDTQDSTIP